MQQLEIISKQEEFTSKYQDVFGLTVWTWLEKTKKL
jgi:hypothetical protein